MKIFQIAYSSFILSLFAVSASEYFPQGEKGAGSALKVVKDQDLREFLQNSKSGEIKELHIAYQVTPKSWKIFFPTAPSLFPSQINNLTSLSLNSQDKRYESQYRPCGFSLIDEGIPLNSLAKFQHLTALDLSYVHLERTKDKHLFSYVDISPLATLPKLSTLILKFVDLENRSFRSFSLFKNLKTLDISHNNINLAFCGFDKGHSDFENLSTLTSLDISFTHAEMFLHHNPFLGNLKKLSIEHNYGLYVPALTTLASLEILNMSDSLNLPSDDLIFLSSLSNLKILDISNNTVYERNLQQLLKHPSLKTIYISERGRYTQNIDRNKLSLKISQLLEETGKELIFKEGDYEREDSFEVDVEGLITTDDMIAYNDHVNRRRAGYY